jgi:hypothetical protein
VGSLIHSHRYRTTVVLLSPRRAVLCRSRVPYENASFGGYEDVEDAGPGRALSSMYARVGSDCRSPEGAESIGFS